LGAHKFFTFYYPTVFKKRSFPGNEKRRFFEKAGFGGGLAGLNALQASVCKQFVNM
jgi:hypothetical protein